MGELKIVGPDGKVIPPPTKGQPMQMPMGGPGMQAPQIVAQIEQFATGQFGIRRVINIAPLDLAKVCANLAASIIQNEQNKSVIAGPGDLPPGAKEGEPNATP